MMGKLDDHSMISTRMHAVAGAQTDDLKSLLALAELNPAADLKFQDWSDVSFENEDLKGFDFSGARLLRCKFKGAKLAGARFDSAIIDWAGHNPLMRTDLSQAADWQEFCQTWTRPRDPVEDGQLRAGMVFQDAPFAPRMVVVPAGTYGRKIACKTETAVTLENPIAVSQFRVTPAELRLFLVRGLQVGAREQGRLSSWLQLLRGPKDDLAAWETASTYVRWLSAETGRRYRLLSESEWEYCARASPRQVPTLGRFGRILRTELEPGLGVPNEFGLYQIGNGTWEWCEDVWLPGRDGSPTDGLPVKLGDPDRRVVRSGMDQEAGPLLRAQGRHVRSHRRISAKEAVRFRVAREIEA